MAWRHSPLRGSSRISTLVKVKLRVRLTKGIRYFLGDFLNRTEDMMGQTTDEATLLNLEFLRLELLTFIDGFPFGGFYFPVSYLEGAQVDFQKLIEWTTFESSEDFADLISRYLQFNTYITEGGLRPGLAGDSFYCFIFSVVGVMREAVRENMTNNIVSMNTVLDQVSHLSQDRLS